jgi:hypothetical protein
VGGSTAPSDTASAPAADAAEDTLDATAERGAAGKDPGTVGASSASEPASGTAPEGKPATGTAPEGEPTAAETGTKAEAKPEAGKRRFRVPFAHATRRLPSPRRVVLATVKAVRTWSSGPDGRLALPALLLLVLMAVAGTAGAVLVPATAPTPVGIVGDPTPTAPGATFPEGIPEPTTVPSLPPTYPPGTAGAPGGRPSAVLAIWAEQTGRKVGVPALALQAYGYAELVLARTMPGCRLTWTTLAAIGKVESDHGRFNGASIGPDGQALPKIIGLPLDGKGGRQRITDTDNGELDGDLVLDRAVGPMQFIPSTWRLYGTDADNDGVANPHSIDDAALTAGKYLCQNGRDLTRPQDWWNAILSYNDVRPYAQAVFDTANQYGTASRS